MITPLDWLAFITFLCIAITLDLGIIGKKNTKPSLKNSIIWTLVWTTSAILFKFYVDFKLGTKFGSEFITAYTLERILSIDNIFVFILVFSYFKTPETMQERALVFGIVIAIILRAVFIALGSALVQSFAWILYIFGAFLVYTGIKILLEIKKPEEAKHLSDNKLMKFAKNHFNIQSVYTTPTLLCKQSGKIFITLFGLTVLTLGAGDVIFAIDSIPAVFSITQNIYVVFTANVFSVLGLRSIFFIIYNIIEKFYYLKHAMSIILTFVGVKMIIAKIHHINTMHSLFFICLVFSFAIILSLLKKPNKTGNTKQSQAAT